MTKRSTQAFKRVMVTVNDVAGGEVLHEYSVNKTIKCSMNTSKDKGM